MDIISWIKSWFGYKSGKKLNKLEDVVENQSLNFDFESTSFILLVFSRSGHFAMLPENLDLDAHIRQYPLQEYGFDEKKYNLRFDRDKMIYLLGLLSSIPARNKDLIREDGFVPFNAEYLNNFMRDYRLYLDYLINTGIVECNNSYRATTSEYVGYSRGYKWTEKYENSDLKAYIYDKAFDKKGNLKEAEPILVKKGQVSQVKNENTLQDYPYLAYWYEQKKINIDAEKARLYAKLLTEKKLNHKEIWDLNKDLGEKKDPNLQYKAFQYNLTALKLHNYRTLIDNNVHRLHSVLTNMQKDYRNFLTYDKEPLVAIDISNSQPYLACLLFNPEFWIENSILPLNLFLLPSNIQQSFLYKYPTGESLPIMLGNLLKQLPDNAFDEYKNIVASGQIYETIKQWIKDEKDITIDRDTAKTTMFQILFSSNRVDPEDENNWLINYYKEKFPAVMEVFKIIKRTYRDLKIERQYARLACLLQAIESEIILHRCCKRIWAETDRQVPIFTIHDSIVTTLGNEDYVYHVMMEELKKCIGIEPKMKYEYWNNKGENLDAEIMQKITIPLD